jgi:hypothetical protein
MRRTLLEDGPKTTLFDFGHPYTGQGRGFLLGNLLFESSATNHVSIAERSTSGAVVDVLPIELPFLNGKKGNAGARSSRCRSRWLFRCKSLCRRRVGLGPRARVSNLGARRRGRFVRCVRRCRERKAICEKDPRSGGRGDRARALARIHRRTRARAVRPREDASRYGMARRVSRAPAKNETHHPRVSCLEVARSSRRSSRRSGRRHAQTHGQVSAHPCEHRRNERASDAVLDDR